MRRPRMKGPRAVWTLALLLGGLANGGAIQAATAPAGPARPVDPFDQSRLAGLEWLRCWASPHDGDSLGP